MAPYPKGHIFWKTKDVSGYRLTHDVAAGDFVKASDFEPIGDVPTPRDGDEMPEWMWEHVLGPAHETILAAYEQRPRLK